MNNKMVSRAVEEFMGQAERCNFTDRNGHLLLLNGYYLRVADLHEQYENVDGHKDLTTAVNAFIIETTHYDYHDSIGHRLGTNQAFFDMAMLVKESLRDEQTNKELEMALFGKTSAMSTYVEAVEGRTMIDYAQAVEASNLKGYGDDLVWWAEDHAHQINEEGIVISPTYMTDKAVGADCFASEDVTINPGAVLIVPTGIKAKFDGDKLGLFPFIRSSIPYNKGLLLANGVGVVEEDYYGNEANDGNIGFMFLNFGSEPVTIKRFERIGQLVLLPIERFENAERAGMERGASGSTGN